MELEQSSRHNWHDWRAIVRRRRWWLLGALYAGGISGALLWHVLPPHYESQALILIQQQQVPTQYVTPNVMTNAADQLQSITQQILSRPRLQNMINSLGLYPGERQKQAMDAVVDRMQRDIVPTPITAPDRPDQLTGFRVSYTASSPLVAQRVVSELTSLFIEDNLKSRAQISADTTSFLQTQLQQAQQNLQTQEAKLSAYKQHNLGELPEQEQGNLAILESLETQYNTAAGALTQAQQEKTYFESLQRQYQNESATGQLVSPDPDSPQVRLKQLETKLADLQSSHTDLYPDVVHTKDEIAKLKKQIAAAPTPGDDKAAAPPTSPIAIEATSRLDALNQDIVARQKTMQQLQGQIQQVQQGLSLTPLREQELSQLEQGVQDAQKDYQSLLQKDQESQLATSLEENQQGERFQVVDPATLPTQPVSPNPLLCLAAGWLLGAALGVGLAMLREMTDIRVNGEPDVARFAAVPVLACVPQMAPSRRSGWLRPGFEIAAAALLNLAAVAAVFLPRI